MKNTWKKISVALILTAMLVSMTACGGNKPEASASDATASSVSSSVASSEAAPSEAAAPAEVTEESYKAEITRIFNDIVAKSSSAPAMDQNDIEGSIKALDTMIADLSPLYTELAAVVAPEALKDKQVIIADGATASVEILDLSKQLLEIAGGTASGDTEKLAAEIQTKIAELTVKAEAFGTAVAEIMA